MNNPFTRTSCACDTCRACCKRQPGSLAGGEPEKLLAWREAQGEDRETALSWFKAHFWASPGALVKDSVTGETQRIGTITPQFKKGRCVFLDENERCTIHHIAPFGCAYFDTHMIGDIRPRSLWLAQSQTDPNYQLFRDALPYATHYRPWRY